MWRLGDDGGDSLPMVLMTVEEVRGWN